MKVITKDNWQEVDPVCKQLLAISLETGSLYPMFPDVWLDQILTPQLSDKLSPELKSLFETARGAMVYGYFYYPLFTVGIEQLSRFFEAAIGEKYNQCGGPPAKKARQFISLGAKLKWLKESSVISEEQYNRFENLRDIRNMAHPIAQSIQPPAYAGASLSMAAEWINELFGQAAA